MFIPLSYRPRTKVKSFYRLGKPYKYECKSSSLYVPEIAELIKDKKSWGILYAVVYMDWFVRNFCALKSMEKDQPPIYIEIDVAENFESPLLLIAFKDVLVHELQNESGERKKRLILKDLTVAGQALAKEVYALGNSEALKKFYPTKITSVDEDVAADGATYYEYQMNNDELSYDVTSLLDNDWFMQYLCDTPNAVLEATVFSNEELDRNPIVQYLYQRVGVVYLSVSSNLSPHEFFPKGIHARKQLFWS
jgi:hypothetical protein